MNLVFYVSVAAIIAWQIVAPLTPLYMDAMGASPEAVGFAISATNVLPLLVALPTGILADAFGSRRIAQLSSVLYAVSLCVLIPAGTLVSLVVAVALIGVGNLGLAISTQTLTATHSYIAQLDRNYSLYAFWVSSGMVVGPIIGGFAADLVGYQGAFVVALGFGILTVLGTFRFQKGRQVPSRIGPSKWLHELVLNSDLRKLTVLFSLSFLIGSAFSIRVTFLPIYFHDVGLSIKLIGLIFAIQGVAAMVVRPLIPSTVLRFGHVATLNAAVVVAAVATAAIPLFKGFVPLAMSGVLLGVAWGFTQPITMSLVASSTAHSARGLAISMRLVFLRLALIFGPVGFGLAVARFGIASAFYLAAGALLLGLIVLRLFPFRLSSPAET